MNVFGDSQKHTVKTGGGERQFHPAAERNSQPIFEVLQGLLTTSGTLLEIASGTGQHAAYMAPRLPHLVWVPSDPDPALRRSIAAWSAEAAAPNLRPPRDIDVTAPEWGVEDIAGDLVAIFNANMIHITPWATCEGLMAGSGCYLRSGGLLCLYGPFSRGGAHTSEGNVRFDAGLRAENPDWGIRALEEVTAEAKIHGLGLHQVFEMPANNLLAAYAKPEGDG